MSIKKNVGWIALGLLIMLSIGFGVYQAFLAPVNAAMFNCGTQECSFSGQDCSGNITCTCRGDLIKACVVGQPEQ